ncbi:MAG TPA: RDD family protein [Actinomycetota bacterium]|nr:RDD family protein [Actinomycetota bacterium]
MGQEPPAQPPMQPPPGGAEPTSTAGGGVSYTAGAGGAPTKATDWWKRLVAAIIDSVILGVVGNILGGIVFAGMFAGMGATEFDPETGQIENPGAIMGIIAAQGALMLALVVLGAAYYVIMHGLKGQTVGKMALKIKVVDEATGGPINYGIAFKRWLLPGLVGVITCGIFSLIDGLWPLWDPKGQAIHDKVAKTLVIDA